MEVITNFRYKSCKGYLWRAIKWLISDLMYNNFSVTFSKTKPGERIGCFPLSIYMVSFILKGSSGVTGRCMSQTFNTSLPSVNWRHHLWWRGVPQSLSLCPHGHQLLRSPSFHTLLPLLGMVLSASCLSNILLLLYISAWVSLLQRRSPWSSQPGPSPIHVLPMPPWHHPVAISFEIKSLSP